MNFRPSDLFDAAVELLQACTQCLADDAQRLRVSRAARRFHNMLPGVQPQDLKELDSYGLARVVLFKYMRMVDQAEGTDFVDQLDCSLPLHDVEWTPEEMALLRVVQLEVAASYTAQPSIPVLRTHTSPPRLEMPQGVVLDDDQGEDPT